MSECCNAIIRKNIIASPHFGIIALKITTESSPEIEKV